MSPEHRIPERRSFRRDEAANYLRAEYDLQVAPRTLAKLAVRGGGPPMEYHGRFPHYPMDGLDAWAKNKISPRVNSTAELRTLKQRRVLSRCVLQPGLVGELAE